MLLIAAIAMLRRRRRFAGRSLGGLLVLWVVYLAVGTVVAVATPQRIQAIGSDCCFDETCFAVEGFRRTPRIEGGGQPIQADGFFYIVNVRVSNRSRGRTQHEAGRKGMLMDRAGHVYDVSTRGTQALVEAEGPSPGLDADLNPGGSVAAKLVFDLPANVKRPGFVLGSSLVFYPPRNR